jgi:hypothetical protein
MNIKYFKDEVDQEQALTTAGDAVEQGIPPEQCFRTVRETMEELAYRTAVTYTDNDEASLYYWTTLKGICCREVDKRSDNVETIPVSR